MKKWTKLIIFLLIMYFTTGCWDRIEVNDLALVMASGVDLTKDGQVEITLQIAHPLAISKTGATLGKNKPVIIVSATGKNGLDALQKLQQQLSRRIFLGYRSVLIIGEKFARHGIKNLMDELSRSPDSRLEAFILTSRNATAKQILEQEYPIESIPVEGLKELQSSNISESTNMNDFLDSLASDEKDPVTGAIALTSTLTTEGTIYQLSGTAVYREDKLVGYLSEEESEGLLWAKGEIERGNITIAIPHHNGSISCQFLTIRSNLHVEVKHQTPKITITVNTSGKIMENDTNLDLSQPKNLKKSELLVENYIKKSTENLMHTTQKKFKSDVLRIGEEIHITNPSFWRKIKKDWKKIYPHVPVSVQVHVTLIRVGRSGAPEQLKENEIKK